VQSFNAGRPFQRGKATYQQVLGLLPKCHVQTAAEAQAAARNAGPGGFQVADTVRILSDGWQEGKVIQVHGRSYVVHLPNGVDDSKMWPTEVRRVGSQRLLKL
jgi:hypothetical protein